jgi:glycine hydroxymethyltransferase
VLCRETHAKALDKTVFPGMQGGPLEHIVAAKAICFREAMDPSFKQYARQIVANAKTLAETLMQGGIRLASGGTDNHLMLCDMTSVGLTGKIAEESLDKAAITVNKNMIPFDQRKPLDPSGIRIGTPALTTRGMREDEMKRVGKWILEVLRAPSDESVIQRVRGEIGEFTKSYPVPGIA